MKIYPLKHFGQQELEIDTHLATELSKQTFVF